MGQFSQQSQKRLDTCHPLLQMIFYDIVRTFDCSIIDGHRPMHRQNQLYREGKSKLIYPNSKHNQFPSLAVDVAPYPIDWADIRRFYYFGGYVLGVVRSIGIKIRWGGDWDGDRQVKDQEFNDLIHFELGD